MLVSCTVAECYFTIILRVFNCFLFCFVFLIENAWDDEGRTLGPEHVHEFAILLRKMKPPFAGRRRLMGRSSAASTARVAADRTARQPAGSIHLIGFNVVGRVVDHLQDAERARLRWRRPRCGRCRCHQSLKRVVTSISQFKIFIGSFTRWNELTLPSLQQFGWHWPQPESATEAVRDAAAAVAAGAVPAV